MTIPTINSIFLRFFLNIKQFFFHFSFIHMTLNHFSPHNNYNIMQTATAINPRMKHMRSHCPTRSFIRSIWFIRIYLIYDLLIGIRKWLINSQWYKGEPQQLSSKQTDRLMKNDEFCRNKIAISCTCMDFFYCCVHKKLIKMSKNINNEWHKWNMQRAIVRQRKVLF